MTVIFSIGAYAHCFKHSNQLCLSKLPQLDKICCKLSSQFRGTNSIRKVYSTGDRQTFLQRRFMFYLPQTSILNYKRTNTAANTAASTSSNLKHCSNLAFVPKHQPCSGRDIEDLQEFVTNSKKLFVLTGAGISTESGIPDYRSEGVGLYATSARRPVQIKDFTSKANVRQRYWARNYVGWPRFSSFQPNITHLTLAQWQRQGKVFHIVTQNVDTLHQKAGSTMVTELHGSVHDVRCMECQYSVTRTQFQDTLSVLNPRMVVQSLDIRPDGDVDLTEEDVSHFTVPPCPDCGGALKPHVVFFGDNVPKARVAAVKRLLGQADALLVLGSSLHVFSAYRFILYGADLGIPMATVNIGPTRGDQHFALRVAARCGHVLPLIRVH